MIRPFQEDEQMTKTLSMDIRDRFRRCIEDGLDCPRGWSCVGDQCRHGSAVSTAVSEGIGLRRAEQSHSFAG